MSFKNKMNNNNNDNSNDGNIQNQRDDDDFVSSNSSSTHHDFQGQEQHEFPPCHHLYPQQRGIPRHLPIPPPLNRDAHKDVEHPSYDETTWFDKLCDRMKVDNDEEDSISSFEAAAILQLEGVAEEEEQQEERTGRDVIVNNNGTGYYQNQNHNHNQLLMEDFHDDAHSSNHDHRSNSVSWSSALLTSPIRNIEDDEGHDSTATKSESTTTNGGKSLDCLLQIASSSSSSIRAPSAQPQPSKSLLFTTTTSTTSTRKRPGGKAMRLISSQKRFQAQHRRHRQSLSFRPLLEMPSEILSSIMGFMDVQTLLNMRFVCKKSKTNASRDDAGWSSHCDRLWKNKVHVSKNARQLHRQQNGQCMKAYGESIRDAHERQHIDDDELCYDPVSHTGTVWSFRFKSTAGSNWTDKDPWYSGGDARQMVFLKDGTIQQLTTTAMKDDSATSTATKATRKLIAPFSDVRQNQQHQHQHQPVLGGGTTTATGIVMTWRYIDQPLDKPAGPRGSYIRINVSGRDVPTYFCQRAPKEFLNWGFVMDSLWGMFASFVIPRRRQVLRLRRTTMGARWLNVDEEMDSDGSDAEEDDENNTNNNSSCNLGRLLSDNALPTTIRRQWKEALIYNTGSLRFLPQGEEGVGQFDRLFIR